VGNCSEPRWEASTLCKLRCPQSLPFWRELGAESVFLQSPSRLWWIKLLMWIDLFYQPLATAFSLLLLLVSDLEWMELLLMYTCSEIMEALKAKWIRVTGHGLLPPMQIARRWITGVAFGTAVGILKSGVAWRSMSTLLEHLQCNRPVSGYSPVPNLVLQKQQVQGMRSAEF